MKTIETEVTITAEGQLVAHLPPQNQNTPASVEDTKKFLMLIAKLLLEIRKSMGNEKTKLDEIQMVAWFFKDIEKLQE